MGQNDQSNRIIKRMVTVGDFVLLNAILLGLAYWHWRMDTWGTYIYWCKDTKSFFEKKEK